ncbi:MAG: outer membrane protein assembly factor BamE [Pontibacterium sp.]
MYKLIARLAATLALTGALSACLGFPGVYKLEIEQGNIISPEQVSQLKPGMSKRQVTYVLGSPLLVDTLNPNHWIYLSRTIQNDEATAPPVNLSLYFDGEQLVSIEPSE